MQSLLSKGEEADHASALSSCTLTRDMILRPIERHSGSEVSYLVSPDEVWKAVRRWGGTGEYERSGGERTFAWLNRFRRLTIRYERRLDIHKAFLQLGCAFICWSYLEKTFC